MNDLPPVPELRWLERDQNPFNMRCLDVRSFTTTMVSTAADRSQAAKFLELRKSHGEQHIGKSPENPANIDCQLIYPHQGATRNGALFLAKEMEDKWDIFLWTDAYFLPDPGLEFWFTKRKLISWKPRRSSQILNRCGSAYKAEHGWRSPR